MGDKSKWEKMAVKDKERYDREMAAYKKKHWNVPPHDGLNRAVTPVCTLRNRLAISFVLAFSAAPYTITVLRSIEIP
jgi:hypothetical protein